MSRDGKGNPGRIILKNQPRLRLMDVLRRRRSTLKSLVKELGISTYAALTNYCVRLGIEPPIRNECLSVFPFTPCALVNSPQEGIVVLNPPPLINESNGTSLDEPRDERCSNDGVVADSDPPKGTSKKRRHPA